MGNAPQWVHETYGFFLAVLTFAIVFGAFSANVLYGAMRAVPRAQLETAEAYGLNRRQTFWRILVPQMWIYALPGLSNLWMVLIKATPLLFLLGVEDIVYWARELGGTANPRFTDYPHGDWRVWYFLALLVFYLGFTRISEIFLEKLMVKFSHGQATTGGHGAKRKGRGMSCWQTVQDYALRSLGIGERLLPREDFTLCEQFTLIGSGMIWNIYFGTLALLAGFFLATAVAVGKGARNRPLRKLSEWFIFVFRGSPLFIQFFFAYFLFLSLKSVSPVFDAFTSAWLGALIVLFLNTAAYSGEIFYGALRAIPRGDVEAADAYGFAGWPRFRRIVWPTMLRLAWPAYINEAIFLFHATTLVFFSGFPAWRQRAMRSITPTTSPTRRSTPSCPIPSWRGISSCSPS